MAKPKVNPDATKNIDAYLAKASDEQRPILELIRKTLNSLDDRILEDWKWGAPCFYLDGLICWFVGFKNHVGVNFYKGALIKDTHKVFIEAEGAEKGNRMIHYHTIQEVDTNALQDYVKQAITLNEQNIKVELPKKVLDTPSYFKEALAKNKAAQTVFDNFTDAQRRDYIEWLTEAKREATRDKRMVQAIEWIAEGKVRNWKYMNC
ncbi:MAG: YdeI/OmpD-associated family protein [Reichenbachiella sp.]|uniref:YdeI/OmpD-associated family protein n=1 Tax=Reichenbachiella sp. TaxID=2184521 RepID=UPI00329A011D